MRIGMTGKLMMSRERGRGYLLMLRHGMMMWRKWRYRQRRRRHGHGDLVVVVRSRGGGGYHVMVRAHVAKRAAGRKMRIVEGVLHDAGGQGRGNAGRRRRGRDPGGNGRATDNADGRRGGGNVILRGSSRSGGAVVVNAGRWRGVY